MRDDGRYISLKQFSILAGIKPADLRKVLKLAPPQLLLKAKRKTLLDRQGLSDRLYAMMKSAKECKADSPLERYTDSPYVFTNAAPNLPAKTRYTRFNNGPWRKALKDSGIKGYRWHDNRHTFASRLKQMGVDDAIVMELGGWKSISMVRRYGPLAGSGRGRGQAQGRGSVGERNLHSWSV